MTFHILGISSSQLTNSFFQRGWNHQSENISYPRAENWFKTNSNTWTICMKNWIIVLYWTMQNRVVHSHDGHRTKNNKTWHSGWWFGTCHIVPYIGNIIIPTDELIFFRGVGQPPTSNRWICWRWWCVIFPLLAPRWETHGLFDCWPFNDLLKQTPGMHCLKIGYPKIPQFIFIFKIQLPFHGYTPFPNIPRLEQVGGMETFGPTRFCWECGSTLQPLGTAGTANQGVNQNQQSHQSRKTQILAFCNIFWLVVSNIFLFTIIYGIILPID